MAIRRRAASQSVFAPPDYGDIAPTSVYVDVSGTADVGPVVCAAALAADEVAWSAFEEEWAGILLDTGAPVFHATDFFTCNGKFAGWPKRSDKQLAFGNRFAKAVASHVAVGWVHGVEVSAFRKHLAPVMRLYKTPHHRIPIAAYCVATALAGLGKGFHKRGLSGLRAVLEDGPGMGEAIGIIEALQKGGAMDIKPYSQIERDKKRNPRLQAADLVAYEARHLFIQFPVVGPPAEVDVRPTLATILDALRDRLALIFAEETKLLESADNNRRFLENYPQYLATSLEGKRGPT